MADNIENAWTVVPASGNHGLYIEDGFGVTVCDLYFMQQHQCISFADAEKNAALIAAAPDLLAALKGLLAHLGPNGYIPGCGKPATDRAREAIAAATGATS